MTNCIVVMINHILIAYSSGFAHPNFDQNDDLEWLYACDFLTVIFIADRLGESGI